MGVMESDGARLREGEGEVAVGCGGARDMGGKGMG